MKLDITVCHSILKFYFQSDYHPISGDQKAIDLAKEIGKNRIVLNDDLIVCYDIEFETNDNLKDIYIQTIYKTPRKES